MPVRIKRASAPRPLTAEWKKGYEFHAKTESGTPYRFRLVNEESLVAVDVNSGKVWWVSFDRQSVILPNTSVRAQVMER